jgi:hypothetical protein
LEDKPGPAISRPQGFEQGKLELRKVRLSRSLMSRSGCQESALREKMQSLRGLAALTRMCLTAFRSYHFFRAFEKQERNQVNIGISVNAVRISVPLDPSHRAVLSSVSLPRGLKLESWIKTQAVASAAPRLLQLASACFALLQTTARGTGLAQPI